MLSADMSVMTVPRTHRRCCSGAQRHFSVPGPSMVSPECPQAYSGPWHNSGPCPVQPIFRPCVLAQATRARGRPAVASRDKPRPAANTALQPLSEQELQALIRSQVVQVRTLHRVPNCVRPWESSSSCQSSSAAFVVDTERGLLMTTAGAVEAARRVLVCRADTDEEVAAQVLAVCPDADVALLRVEPPAHQPNAHAAAAGSGGVPGSRRARPARGVRPGRGGRGGAAGTTEGRFWQGLQSVQWGPLPQLQDAVRVAGFPIGGDSLAVTSGVVSRCEVLEYSHSNRNLLALQVDAPLNNGVWGGPVYDACGRVLGMAFQKFTSQTWMERYDEEGLESLGGGGGGGEAEGDEEDGGDGGGGGGGGRPGGVEEDDGVENVGYCVPSLLLRHALQDWEAAVAAGHAAHLGSTMDGGPQQPMEEEEEEEEDEGVGASSGSGHREQGVPSGPVVLEGFPVLGLRWQRLESPALRAELGLQQDESGIRVSALDPSGSCAGVLQPGDVITSVGGCAVSNDGTILLRPRQRVLFGHAAALRHVGGDLPVTVVREGRRLDLELRLRHTQALVPTSSGSTRPLYLILGGVVLLQLTLPYLYHRELPRSKGSKLPGWSWGHLGVVQALEWGLPAMTGGEQVIICSEMLAGSVADEEYSGDLGACMRRLTTVNGTRVLNMEHLVKLVLASEHAGEGATEQRAPELSPGTEEPSFVQLGFSDGSVMVLDAAALREETQVVLVQQGISHAMSARLRAVLPDHLRQWPSEAGTVSAPIMQKRQQRRRLAIRR